LKTFDTIAAGFFANHSLNGKLEQSSNCFKATSVKSRFGQKIGLLASAQIFCLGIRCPTLHCSDKIRIAHLIRIRVRAAETSG